MYFQAIIEFIKLNRLPWLILAIIIWIINIYFFNLKQFIYALPGGIFSMLIGASLETFFIAHKFWFERYLLIPVGKLDVSLIIGPFFSIGLWLIRLLPNNRLYTCCLILLLSALATGVEYIFIQFSILKYDTSRWSYYHSLFTYYLGLVSTLGLHCIYYGKTNTYR